VKRNRFSVEQFVAILKQGEVIRACRQTCTTGTPTGSRIFPVEPNDPITQ